jgi:chemotaxis protein methyltransferase CheR
LTGVSQDPAYHRLKDHLIESTGLAFYADRDSKLTELIGQRLADLRLLDYSAYAEFLADGAGGKAEMELLTGQLTIGETYFFRDPEQFAAIRDVILPDILERKRTSGVLRIWSAGCATGAEPYSLAILLMREMASRISGWQVDIQATDLNRSYLTQAAEGKFRDHALDSTSDEVKRECFSKQGRIWTIDPRYKQWISFRHMNLVDSQFPAPLAAGTQFDLILCRNVMIYFTPAVNRRLVGRFHQSLGDEGWLVVGASEHNLENYQEFRSVNVAGATLYQKAPLPVEQMAIPEVPVAKSRPPAQALAKMPAQPLAKMPAEPSPANVGGLLELANRGEWQSAAEYGQELLTVDRLNPTIHFYQALIFENLGIADQSERSLRQAIYLDRNFALAHYHLGLALKRSRQMLAADRSFGNVLRVLAAEPEDGMVVGGPGVTVTGLRELARMHLEKSGKS